MKSKLILLLVLWLALEQTANAQLINYAEFYIDNFNLPTTVMNIIPPSAIINIQNISMSTSGLPPGYRALFVRARTTTGKWSLYGAANFYIKPVITYAESFVDNDPGYGLGNPIPFTPSDVINVSNVSIPTTGIADIHNLHIRSRDNSGKWSHYGAASFFECGITAAIAQGSTVNICPGGSTTLNAIAPTNYAANFDGVNDYVKIPNKGNFDFNDFTIEGWFNVNAFTHTELDFVAKEGLPLTPFEIEVRPTSIRGYVLNGTPIDYNLTVNLNQWYHIAMTRQGSTVTMYVNGVAGTTASRPGTTIGTEDVFIGADDNTHDNLPDDEWFNGKIDEVYLWNVARTPSQIQSDMTNSVANTLTNANLVGAYHFDEGSGTTAQDHHLVGNNKGTLVNGTSYVVSTAPVSRYTYSWTPATGLTSTTTAATSASPTSITAYTVTINDAGTGCSGSASINVTVLNPAASSNSPSATPLCNGSTLNLFCADANATAWAWTGPNGFNSAQQNPTITNITGVATGTYTVVVHDASNCNATATTGVVINTSSVITTCPSVSPVNNTTGQCGATVNYPAAIASGTPAPTVTYSQNSGTFFPAGTTSVTVSATNTCGTTTCSFNVVVNDNQLPSITSPAPVTVNTGTGTCTKCSVALGTPVTSDNCGVLSVTNNAPSCFPHGQTVVTWTATDYSGNTRTSLQSVIVLDNEPPTITCPSSVSTCSATPALGTPGTGDNCGVLSSSNNAPGSFPVGITNVIWTVTDIHGNTNACTQQVTRKASPIAIISSFSPLICIGQPATMHLVFSGTGPWNYTITDGTQNIPLTSTVNPDDKNIVPLIGGIHIYTVTGLTDANCPGTNIGTAIVTVSTNPPTGGISGITGAAEACANDVKLMTATTTVSGPNIFYVWVQGTNSSVVYFSNSSTGPFLPGSVVSTTNTIYAKFISLSAGSTGYEIGVKAFNGCGNGTSIRYASIRGATSTPGYITGPTVVCPNQTGVSYTAGTVTGAGVYTWSFPGAVITPAQGQGTPNITMDFPANTTGLLCVTSAVSCSGGGTGMQSQPYCTTIYGNVPTHYSISGPATVCPGSSIQYTYTTQYNPYAISYRWTLPSGVVGSSTTNSIGVIVNSLAGTPNIWVKALTSCPVQTGDSTGKTIASGIPLIPSNIIGPLTGVCSGNQLDYSVTNVPGTTYNWTVPSAATGVSANGSNSIHFFITGTPVFGSGEVKVTATNGPCAASEPRKIVINGAPAQPATLTSNPNPVCINQPVSFTSAVPVGANPNNFIWSVSGGSITSTPPYSNIINVVWGSGNGLVSASGKNVCGIGSAKVINPLIPGCREEEEFNVQSTMFNVFPNPAHDMLTLSIDAKEDAMYSIQLTDLAGRVVQSSFTAATAGMNAYEMDLSSLAKGVYMLTVQSANESWKTKVMVE